MGGMLLQLVTPIQTNIIADTTSGNEEYRFRRMDLLLLWLLVLLSFHPFAIEHLVETSPTARPDISRVMVYIQLDETSARTG